ncbi:MAG: NAD(P)-dependent oxidoreductase [Planctomycetia bacterium]|nr:NAD(P)-dependent oxidoreductase [Planctomycetia bacterium]
MASAVSIGFIGTGIMGGRMAAHLLSAGSALHVHNRSRSKAEPLLAAGGVWHDSPGTLAAASDVVITMLGLPADVAEVYFGGTAAVAEGEGVIARARPGTLLIDMTTSSPSLAERIAGAAARHGLSSIDAPVSGGDVGARDGTLVIMAGGDPPAFDRALPILSRMGRSVTLLGAAGAGQRCKLANQIAVAVGMVAWCEALAHARAGGLDPALVQRVIAGGAAGSWALTNLAPRALSGDFAPGFLVRHLIKDIGIARQCADEDGLDLPGLAIAEQLYEAVAARGCTDAGTQSLYRLYAAGHD